MDNFPVLGEIVFMFIDARTSLGVLNRMRKSVWHHCRTGCRWWKIFTQKIWCETDMHYMFSWWKKKNKKNKYILIFIPNCVVCITVCFLCCWAIFYLLVFFFFFCLFPCFRVMLRLYCTPLVDHNHVFTLSSLSTNHASHPHSSKCPRTRKGHVG